MIEYIAIGAGIGLAIGYSIYEDYMFKKFDKEVKRCGKNIEKLIEQLRNANEVKNKSP